MVLETPQGLQAMEIKSGTTFASDWAQAARKWASFAGPQALPPIIVYGGEGRFARQDCEVRGWREFAASP